MERDKSKDLSIVLRSCTVNPSIPEEVRQKFLLYELKGYPLREDGERYKFGRFISEGEHGLANDLSMLRLVHVGFNFKNRKSTVSITQSGENILGGYDPQEDLEKYGITSCSVH